MRNALFVGLLCCAFTGLAHAGYVSSLQELSPSPTTFVFNVDQTSFSYGGPGTAFPSTGSATGLLESAANLGCNASDFSGFAPGGIALIERGTCAFSVKGINAENAGAVAFIVFDDINGIVNRRQWVFAVPGPNIPGVFATLSVGQSLLGELNTGPVDMALSVTNVPEPSSLAMWFLPSLVPAARWLLRRWNPR
jgi:hypothetical protein